MGAFLRDNRVTLLATAAALALTAAVVLLAPSDRELTSVWELLFKLTPFTAATIAIGWLDVEWARRLRLPLVLLPVAFLVVLCWFIPKIFFFGGEVARFDDLYNQILLLVPFLILVMVLSFRLGGGATGTAVRLSFALLVLQLSGIEDLAYQLVNNRGKPIPEVWDWASHITIFLGHPATKAEAFGFIGVHVGIALVLLVWPFRKRAAKPVDAAPVG